MPTSTRPAAVPTLPPQALATARDGVRQRVFRVCCAHFVFASAHVLKVFVRLLSPRPRRRTRLCCRFSGPFVVVSVGRRCRRAPHGVQMERQMHAFAHTGVWTCARPLAHLWLALFALFWAFLLALAADAALQANMRWRFCSRSRCSRDGRKSVCSCVCQLGLNALTSVHQLSKIVDLAGLNEWLFTPAGDRSSARFRDTLRHT